MSDNTDLQNYNTQVGYKHNIKSYLLKVQSSGNGDEWQSSYFKLTSIKGLRQSDRLKLRN